MGSKKKQTATTQNTYNYIPTPVTPQITAAETSAAALRDKVNPMIRQQYAGARDQLNNRFQNPMGSFTTPAMREATLNAGNEELNQQEAGALTNAEYMANNADFERQMAIAGLTMPRLVQTGGTQTQTQSGGLFDSVLGTVGQVGSAALM